MGSTPPWAGVTPAPSVKIVPLEFADQRRRSLDCLAAGRAAIGAYVQVLVALRQDEQQALADLDGALAFRTRQQTGFHPLERWPSLLWHRPD